MLSILNSFSLGFSSVSLGFDNSTNNISVYGGFASEIENYDLVGNFLTAIPRPGEGANDFDISFSSQSFTLGSTNIAAGTLLAINGESGTTDIYAIDKSTGNIIETLVTDFGTNHIVGGAYHPIRDTFFLVQDKLTLSLIAEIDPKNGEVLNTFSPGAGYSINFGDLEVNETTGNLLVVSSDESSIREFTPGGTVLQDLALPSGVSSLSGIGLDETNGEIWVNSTGGTVWQLDGLPNLSSCNPTIGDDDLTACATFGDDSVNGLAGNDTLDGVAGNDTLVGGNGNDLIFGGNNNDLLKGDSGNDTLDGGNDNDNLIGAAGDDSLIGGAGDDSLRGGGDSDTLEGGSGNDTLIGGGKADTLIGGDDDDSLIGGAGDDSLEGNSGNDTINGSKGSDLLDGSIGEDELNGGDGNDTLLGGDDNDSLSGNGKNDRIEGEEGDDTLVGGSNNDTLIGGNGNDSLTGSVGADEFVFNAPSEGIDTIVDFNSSQGDIIVIDAGGFGGGLTPGSLANTDFVLGTSASDASDRFIYDNATGDLLFDNDGTGASAAIQIASLSNLASLTARDFTLI